MTPYPILQIVSLSRVMQVFAFPFRWTRVTKALGTRLPEPVSSARDAHKAAQYVFPLWTLILHRRHVEHSNNLRDEKNYVVAKACKNIAPETCCFWSWCWFTGSTFVHRTGGKSRLFHKHQVKLRPRCILYCPILYSPGHECWQVLADYTRPAEQPAYMTYINKQGGTRNCFLIYFERSW